MKYLGAHIQDNGHLRVEVRKRIASAKAGFARFAAFFKKRGVPLERKVLVFKAVVNEALLSALEVRPLTPADEHELEAARGLLLRRLFGRSGYGAVAGNPSRSSVSLHNLRQRAGVSTVASELRVRRLLWLRSALTAEAHGQARLELATIFGQCPALKDSIDDDTGLPTLFAPKFFTCASPRFAGVGPWLLWVSR